jgi:hypothetical protein
MVELRFGVVDCIINFFTQSGVCIVIYRTKHLLLFKANQVLIVRDGSGDHYVEFSRSRNLACIIAEPRKHYSLCASCIYFPSSSPSPYFINPSSRKQKTLDNSKVFWRTVFIASGLASLFVFFTLFGDDKDASDWDENSNHKYRGRRRTRQNVRKQRRNDNKPGVDEQPIPGDVDSDVNIEKETRKQSYKDSNTFWTGEYSYDTDTTFDESSPLSVHDLDAKPNVHMCSFSFSCVWWHTFANISVTHNRLILMEHALLLLE